MKLVFTGSFEDLQAALAGVNGKWDSSQPNKKVLRARGGVLNWYVSTGTIQLQGKEPGRTWLENQAKYALSPSEFPSEESDIEAPWDSESPEEPTNADSTEITPAEKYLAGAFEESELVIGIVTAVGTETERVVTPLTDRLKHFGYEVEHIRVSTLLTAEHAENEYERIKGLMAAGDEIRKNSGNNAILAYGAAKLIHERRDESKAKRAYIINSLKHPDEVGLLRKIYGQGFYLFGVHADKVRRLSYLTNDKGLTPTQAAELTDIDEDEKIPHGQRTRDTYHLADFFLNFGKNDDQVKNTIQRFLELIFSHPYKNPTFDEFSMFMAFSSSVRSGDLSRQVGAVITRNQQIIATGANECPVSGGGLYWSKVDPETGEVIDSGDGKDYTREQDSNKAEQQEIIQSILSQLISVAGTDEELKDRFTKVLEQSRISDLTEFGRVVHAEMEAIISCARAGIDCVDSTMYCTTFPCHNCAKHIIASGISRVVYVEPYPKSKALELHSESIELKTKLDAEINTDRVVFEPFTGVGARRFLDFFSMNLGVGNKLRRKNKDGTTVSWEKKNAKLRVPLLPASYRDIEETSASLYAKVTDA
ncbi:deoxycytidylate deaminase [Desulfolithobacter dissulfuricans]|uniref:Deoxycytidylate deaminase n=1 Tax=Desulfolithobacter dissulfuricans TaxID=2795293 RepID=A0A915UB45_9BACT|nr:anti-phage dCTP deaminase [Desulfolithobacter dissulfuricans]BCO10626.1 deoxycytidylate deaminase [Desulfolithobacter dissulfuricans]